MGTFDPHSAGQKAALRQLLSSSKQGTDSPCGRSSLLEWGRTKMLDLGKTVAVAHLCNCSEGGWASVGLSEERVKTLEG